MSELHYSSPNVRLDGVRSQSRCPKNICPDSLRSTGCLFCDTPENSATKCVTCMMDHILFNGTCVPCVDWEECPFNNSNHAKCIDNNPDLSLCEEVANPVKCLEHVCISHDCLYGNFGPTKECAIGGKGCRGCKCVHGWYPNMTSDCYSVCGDGNLTFDKECEVNGVGCGSDCKCSDGWETQRKVSCKPICGDGKVVGDEECDSGSGCGSMCRCNVGWYPSSGDVSCHSICGDGNTVGDEECDRTLGCNDDFCLCVDKYPYSKITGTCIWCGNGVVESGEECDGGTGCGSDCLCVNDYKYDQNKGVCVSKKKSVDLKLVLFIVACGGLILIVVIILIVISVVRRRRKKEEDEEDGKGIEMDSFDVVVGDGKKVGTLVITKTTYDNPTTIVMMGKMNGKVEVAVKCMKMWGTQLDSKQEREMEVMRKLKSEYVVTFYGTSVVEGRTGLVMEYIAMGSLETLMLKTELGTALKMRYAKDICSGMCYLHKNKIIHRDLKLSNVLVVSDDENSTDAVCKISDFGTSRDVDITTTLSMTHSMTMTSNIGTPLYMAPEILNGSGRYSMSADVYSYGIVLAGLWNQTIPYSDQEFESPIVFFKSVVEQGLRPTIRDDCPQHYINLANACWHQDPHQRPKFSDISHTVFGV